MNPEPRISATGLGKAFLLQKRVKAAGVATDSAAALWNFLRNVWRGNRQDASLGGDAALFHALSNVSFDVLPGEVLGIIGRNGAGKSTLLRVLARVLEPSQGEVRIQGKVVSLLELGVGFSPELTVRENIRVYGRLAGFSASTIESSERDILAFARLDPYADTQLEKCPSGSFVQLGFAAMINLQANIILADEVLAVGDSEFRQLCEDRIRLVAQSGESVLFVSHDMNAIRRCCTRVIWIDKGSIRMDGPTDAVVDAYIDEVMSGRIAPLEPGKEADACRLLDLRLLDENAAQVGALQIGRAAKAECLFRIDHPDIAVRVVMELWYGKSLVLRAPSTEYFTVRQPQTLRAALPFPPHFLNDSSYRIVCTLVPFRRVGNERSPLPSIKEELSFSVMNPQPEQSVWAGWEWGHGGMLAPRLEWQVSHEARDNQERS